MARDRSKAADEAWEFVEREKRIDRFIRRVSICAWGVTLFIVLVFGILTGIEILEMVRGFWRAICPSQRWWVRLFRSSRRSEC